MDNNVKAVTEERGVLRLNDEEIEQARSWASQHLDSATEQWYEEAASRIAELERQLDRYRAVIDLEEPICPWTSLTVVQEYLRDYDDATVPFKRQGKITHIIAINNQAMAITRDQGLIRLSDLEIEQCRLYVLRKPGQPVVVSVSSPENDD